MEPDAVEMLSDYFAGRRDVAFAFLYGSHARGTATARSDVDIAVYFHPKRRRPLEFEEPVFYDTESGIWGDLLRLLGAEVELLVLNRAPADISASAIRGKPLAIRDWGLYLDYLEVVTEAAADHEETLIREYEAKNGIAKRD